jgi:hypothetical protein
MENAVAIARKQTELPYSQGYIGIVPCYANRVIAERVAQEQIDGYNAILRNLTDENWIKFFNRLKKRYEKYRNDILMDA